MPESTCEEVNPPELEKCDDGLDLPVPEEVPTYEARVGSILQNRCARCHQEGGIGTFAIESYDDAVAHKDAIGRAVADRTMPPWMPAKCCTEYEQDFSLSAEEIADVVAWVDGGAPRGTPALPVEAEGTTIAEGMRTDVRLEMADSYTRNPPDGTTDDTRCFMVDWPYEDTQYVTGFRFEPGNAAVVHHAVVLIIGESSVPSYEWLDDQDEAYGWSCPAGAWSAIQDISGGGRRAGKGKRPQTVTATGWTRGPRSSCPCTIRFRRGPTTTSPTVRRWSWR